MPATVSIYDHTALRFFNGANAPGDTYLVNLYTVLPFIRAATTKAAAEVGATQIPTANGYTQDAKLITSVAFATVTTNDANMDGADIVWTPTAATIAANYAAIFNTTDSGSPPLMHYDFGGTITATFSPLVPFTIAWNALGIALSTVA